MRKKRIRQDIIEDLGFNYVERQVLLADCIIQRYFEDYGYDGEIHTFDADGFYEIGYALFQLKSTDKITFSKSKNAVVFDLSKRDLELWLYETAPVLVILYDAKADKSYFVELQAYFKNNKIGLQNVRKFVRIYMPIENIFDISAVQLVRNLKNGF
jgi:hypothetical protein